VGAVNNVEDDKDEPRWHGEAPYLRRARRILPQEDGKTRGRSGVYGGPEPQPGVDAEQADCVVAFWDRILEEISLDDLHARPEPSVQAGFILSTRSTTWRTGVGWSAWQAPDPFCDSLRQILIILCDPKHHLFAFVIRHILGKNP
jgi:hypothetical protein